MMFAICLALGTSIVNFIGVYFICKSLQRLLEIFNSTIRMIDIVDRALKEIKEG